MKCKRKIDVFAFFIILHFTSSSSNVIVGNSRYHYAVTGEGNGNPLQYSSLENPMDGGAGWAPVHGVSKTRPRLSDFTFTFDFHSLQKEMTTHSSVLAWRIPGRAEPFGLLSMGSHRVGHVWSDFAATAVLNGSLNFEKVTDQFLPYKLWFIKKIILHSWSLNNMNLNWACPLIFQ